ncbi:restriction endonuclease [Arthrobacter sp. KK5.5]|uniref:restriction endonuclease n=1 Tax=Arthrobacter sp. KK5.5 TaxID=3373084 RepID=UPI003EE62C62
MAQESKDGPFQAWLAQEQGRERVASQFRSAVHREMSTLIRAYGRPVQGTGKSSPDLQSSADVSPRGQPPGKDLPHPTFNPPGSVGTATSKLRTPKAISSSFELVPPPVRPSCTFREAELYCREWLEALGATGTRVSQATRDGGADIIADRCVAEVKHHASPIGPGPVRQIAGVATTVGKQAIFFSLSGYSRQAIEFGSMAGVLLFQYDPAASQLTGLTTAARQAMQDGLPT